METQTNAITPSFGAKVDSNPRMVAERKSAFRGTLWFAAFGIAIWCVIEAKEFLIPLVMAALLAMLMAPITRLLKRVHVPEGLAVAITTLILYLPMIGLASLVLVEATSIVHNWPTIYASAKTYLDKLLENPHIVSLHLGNYIDFSDLQSKISARAGEGALLFVTGLATILSAGTTMILVLTFAAIMLASRNHLRSSFELIFDANAQPGETSTLDGSLSVLEKFLVARVLMIVFVAVADYIILLSFGVPYAITLAVLLGVSTLIPIIGFYIGIIPPVIVAASLGHGGLYLVGLFAALWLISSAQDHILTPKLIGEKLNLNFLATYLAVFAGEQIWGIWGMFLAIPALGLLRVIFSASESFQPWARLIEESKGDAAKTTAKIKTEEAKADVSKQASMQTPSRPSIKPIEVTH